MFDTPGVFIREIPSGSRPIAGVATSNTAFVGTFARGPVNRATRITSFGEFERIFGGLHPLSETSYAIRAYFLNGGSVAFVVRVTAGAAALATCAIGVDIDFNATSEGAWANNVRIGVAHGGAGTSYTILVREYDDAGTAILREEAHIDVSITPGSPRFVEDVLTENSELLTATQNNEALPAPTQINGADAATLDDLLEGVATDFTAMGSDISGADGTMEGDGAWAAAASAALRGNEGATPPTGIYALNQIVPQVFNLLCLPGAANFNDPGHAATVAIYQEAYTYCRNNFAFLLVDPAPDVNRGNIQTYLTELGAAAGPNAALYYPRVTGADPLNALVPRVTGPSGIAAGLIARTDGARGVWKAPAGTEARVSGATPTDVMTDRQQGPLNTSGVNVIRTFPVYNSVVWGARTLDGADARASEWRYVNVRRLALFIENSLQRGLQWVVFEPNDEPLWANVRMNVNGFMNQLHRQGAFQGASARDAYLVKCDSETTTQADINLGILNVYVGFAPVRPAEFVVIRIQQRFPNAA
ncbi:phage tail sheath C-terminal domain-containing protein [Yoonia sp. BS5-3]|uniref:Phage tail sheath family protein n=1 Tax=Yoonia phaeophyticola TaxID=3137369 RepID=A0ABZ2V6V1_9RHOB